MTTYKIYYKGFFKGTVEAESERDALLQAHDRGEWPDANHLVAEAVDVETVDVETDGVSIENDGGDSHDDHTNKKDAISIMFEHDVHLSVSPPVDNVPHDVKLFMVFDGDTPLMNCMAHHVAVLFCEFYDDRFGTNCKITVFDGHTITP